MAESSIVKNFRDGSVSITNGTRTYTVSGAAGDVKISGLNHGKAYDLTNIMDRGEPMHRRRTNKRPIPVSFTVWFRDLVDASDVTFVGMMLQQGACASDLPISGVSTTEVYETNIRFTINGTNHGDPSNHVCLLEKFALDDLSIEEGEDKTKVTVTGNAYGTITFT